MNKRIVAANLIEKDGKVLLIQETKKSCFGLWNFPAGKLDPDESPEEAAIREGKEESGFDLKIEYLIGVFSHPADDADDTVVDVHVFKTDIKDGELIEPNEEIMDLKWFSIAEIEQMFNENKLRKPFIWEAIKQYFEEKK